MSRQAMIAMLLLLGISAPARAAAYNFGAVAFDQDRGAWGYSYNWASQPLANAEAMRRCHGHCKVIGEFWNNCGSLSAAKDGSYGWDANMDERVATRRALANCNRYGKSCQIKVTVCNDAPRSRPSTTTGGKELFIGRHGCWYSDWSRIPGCRD